MSAESDPRVEALFHEMVGLPPDRRARILHDLCPESELRAQVETLLHHHDQLGASFLGGATSGGAGSKDAPAVDHAGDGVRIGPYALFGVLGEGGMGTVYEAEQDHPRRRVALKLIRPGLVTPSMRRRFEYEADMLGRLEHPGIARIYHAGIADTAHGPQPYFAMELVQGTRLDQWVKQRDPPLKERLKLLIEICHAVHHAHTKGVIHRDLKPANILITPDGHPKILDFGVARATDSDIQAATMHTESGQMVGTLPYMAPEQAAGKARELDTSSDVYALGVIAYELLSGKMPYALDGKALHDAVRIICEQEPSRLSSIDKNLRGDVETIIGKALEKDKTRRYHTAGEFAADVKRYLDYEPITARPPETWYQLRKFAGRNRLLVSSVAMIMLLLVGGVVTSTYFAINARRQKSQALAQQKRAESQAHLATAVSHSLQQMLSSANPEAAKGTDYTVRQMLDEYADRIGEKLADYPEAEADLQTTIGRAYRRLSDGDKAEKHLARALELRRQVFGPQHERFADSLVEYASALREQDQVPKAEACTRQALDIYRARGVSGQPVIRAYSDLIVIFRAWGRSPDEFQSVAEQGLAVAQQSQGEYPETAVLYSGLAESKRARQDYAEAERLERKALALNLNLLGPDHPETGFNWRHLGETLLPQRRFAESLEAQKQSLAAFRKAYPADHWSYGQTLSAITTLIHAAGDADALLELFSTPEKLHDLEQVFRQALMIKPTSRWDDPAATGARGLISFESFYLKLAAALEAAGKTREGQDARRYATEVREYLRTAMPDDPSFRRTAYIHLLEPLIELGRRDQAKDYCRILLQLNYPDPVKLSLIARRLATSPDPAQCDAEIAVMLAERAVQIRPTSGAYHNTLGIARYRMGDFKQAAADLEKSVQLRNGGDSYDFFFLAIAHQRLGNTDTARQWYDRAVLRMQKSAPENAELRRFQCEAAQLLGLKVQPASQPATRPSADK